MGLISKLVFYTKSIVAVALLGSCALYGVIASIVLGCIGKRHLAQWTTARSFYNVMGPVFGVEIKVINPENLEKLPAIFVSNHQSELDILMLGRTFPQGCTVTAKQSLKYVPFLGWFMALSGTLFLDRSNRKKSVATLNKALQELSTKKRAIWVFPEGTRSYTTKVCMLPFKKGAFHLAQQGKIPIVPVIVSNTSTIFNPKLGIFNRGTIVVKVLDPIPTEDLKKEEVGEFTNKVRDLMERELENLKYSKAINDTGLPEEVASKASVVEQEGQESNSNSHGIDDTDSISKDNSTDEVEEIVQAIEEESAPEQTEEQPEEQPEEESSEGVRETADLTNDK